RDTAARRFAAVAFGLNFTITECASYSALCFPAANGGRYGRGSAADPLDPVTTTTPPAIIAAGITSRSKRLLNTTNPQRASTGRELTTCGLVLNRRETPRRYTITRPVGNRVRT